MMLAPWCVVTDWNHAAMPPLTPPIAVPEDALTISFVRASGRGGQNVNKLATAAQLRCDTGRLQLTDDIAARLRTLAGSRMTADGVIVIHAQRFRTQERNRQDALERLTALLQQATERPAPRRPTRPTYASKLRRLEGKKRRGSIKAGRGTRGFDD
jgi:ribosome-associated protein